MFLRADATVESMVLELVPAHAALERRLSPALALIGNALPADLLQQIETGAQALGVPADVYLLQEGYLSADCFYRLVSAKLGIPFAERPMALAAGAEWQRSLASGIVPLRPNRLDVRFLAAPRGAGLAGLLRLAEQAGPSLPAIALTTPDRFEALLRRTERRDVARLASHALPDWNGDLSARSGLSDTQTVLCGAAAMATCLAAWFAPAACVAAIHLTFFVAFTLLVLLRLWATAASLADKPAPILPVDDRDLPVYTIIVPLYRETRVVQQLVAALDRLAYPRAKLDIILMVEPNDPATLDAIEALRLPGCYRAIMAPRGRPQTKPRALNVALQFARGDFVVVYDAEDEPEPDQLRDALARFAATPDLACLQARLAIDNTADSWLTRLFTVEYAALFDVINPGLAALGLPIPLGGTSNHFRMEALRALKGWDAWNVTEDIDLGIRLARFGYRVETLASTTFEEAPHTLKAWLAQRRRWLKGWVVTLGTHTRAPMRLVRDLGPRRSGAVLAMLFGTTASCLLGPFCCMAVLLRLWNGDLLNPQTPGDALWSALSLVLILLGITSALWPAMLGLHHRRWTSLVPWLWLLPAYLLLLSLAAWQATFEALRQPYSWSKTEHGRAKKRLRAGAG